MTTNEIYKKGIEEFNKNVIDYFWDKETICGTQRLSINHIEKIKSHIKTLTLDILKAEIERLKNTMLGGTIINRDTGVYNNVLQDQINYYQEQIKIIEEI